MPASINLSAANKPVGPAPIITTCMADVPTSLKENLLVAAVKKGSSVNAFKVRFINTVLPLASIDFFSI